MSNADLIDDLTIVIPAFGLRDGLLERAIRSAGSCGVLVVDDATPGDSVQQLACRLDVGYVRRESNGGVAAAQNTGLACVTTTWVQFIHSDDRLPQSALTVRRTEDFDVVQGVSSTSRVVSTVNALDEAMLLEHRIGVHISNAQFRTRVLQGVAFDPELRAWEDWDVLYRLLRSGARIDSVDSELSWLSDDARDRLVNSSAMLEGLIHLYEKNANVFNSNRRVRAIWEFKIARALARAGLRRDASRWMIRSLKTEPLHPHRVVVFARLCIGQRR